MYVRSECCLSKAHKTNKVIQNILSISMKSTICVYVKTDSFCGDVLYSVMAVIKWFQKSISVMFTNIAPLHIGSFNQFSPSLQKAGNHFFL